jgi:hypothetical protein
VNDDFFLLLFPCRRIFFELILKEGIDLQFLIHIFVHLRFGLGGSRASEFPRDHDGACLQMRLSYSPAAHFLLFLVRWTDCSLAGALGLLRILIYKVCDISYNSSAQCLSCEQI